MAAGRECTMSHVRIAPATIAARELRQRGGRSSVLFYSRRIHTWPHEAPEAARPLRSPRDRVLVRCCIPSARYALSAAAVWPPAGLPGAPLADKTVHRIHRRNSPNEKMTPFVATTSKFHDLWLCEQLISMNRVTEPLTPAPDPNQCRPCLRQTQLFCEIGLRSP